MWGLSGRSQGSAVFLSTAPVAGKGGDPVSFAMGWPLKHFGGQHPGYLIVVDLPPEAFHLVHALVPNVELDSFISVFRTRSLLRETVRLEAGRGTGEERSGLARWTLSQWCLHYWLARYCADHQIALTPSALDAIIPLQVGGIDPALPSDLTPLRWQAFLDDYFRVVAFADWDIDMPTERERRRRAVLRHHGIVLPDHIEADDHSRRCRLCISGLVRFVYRFEGFATYQPLHAFLRTLPMKSSYQRLPEAVRVGPYVIEAPLAGGALGSVQSLALRLRAVRAHALPFSDEAILSFFRTHEASGTYQRETSWTWEQWYAHFPAERCTLPHAWHPGFDQHFSAADLKRPDCQVITAAIPPRYILGAIKISDGVRLVPHLRPNRRTGETLAAKLWKLAHTLRARYAGTPVLLD